MARRFNAQLRTIENALRRVMDEMGAKNWKIIQENGIKITIAFTLPGSDGVVREYQYVSDWFEHQTDNYRAAQLAITRLWAIYNEWHIRVDGCDASMETILKGFQALPSQQVFLAITDGKKQPWEVLGISRNASREEISGAYRELAKKNHPDVGGDEDFMERLNSARDEMLAILE